ncbi:MAG: hypothetical protein Q8P64_10985 [Deltaproteobacteria bacterium]|nr:hypothetical protein [Deltaproteobacteria bacterium]
MGEEPDHPLRQGLPINSIATQSLKGEGEKVVHRPSFIVHCLLYIVSRPSSIFYRPELVEGLSIVHR